MYGSINCVALNCPTCNETVKDCVYDLTGDNSYHLWESNCINFYCDNCGCEFSIYIGEIEVLQEGSLDDE